jgi:hypothetical protein
MWSIPPHNFSKLNTFLSTNTYYHSRLGTINMYCLYHNKEFQLTEAQTSVLK